MNQELEILDFIDAENKGSVFYDLGACEGRFSLYAAYNGLRCYAFEPESRNFKTLNDNLLLNKNNLKGSLQTFKIAVGESAHNSHLNIGQPWAGGHHRIVASSNGRNDLSINAVEQESIQVRSLDKFINEKKLPIPNAIKVDIDGSEKEFINGAQKTLSETNLERIIIELNKSDINYNFVISNLKSHGFIEKKAHYLEGQLYNILLQKNTKPA